MIEAILPADGAPDWWPVGMVAGGAAWGWALGRIIAYPQTWRLVLAGGLGIFIGWMLATSGINDLAARLWPDWSGSPPHTRFAMVYVLAVSINAAVAGFALGLAVQSWRTAAILALASSLSAAIPAALVILILDRLGLRVGTGNAAMAKVASLGFLAATLFGGAAIGLVLARRMVTTLPDAP